MGDWKGGFAVNLGKGQILEAEMWGLFFGLKLAVDKRLSPLIVEMDSAIAIHLINKTAVDELHPLAGLIASCRNLMNMLNICDVNHIYRKKNRLADCMAT
ncbi:hypothetical protein CerSpe_148610 [Prunus speciosa]